MMDSFVRGAFSLVLLILGVPGWLIAGAAIVAVPMMLLRREVRNDLRILLDE
jgi:hypothetical protein